MSKLAPTERTSLINKQSPSSTDEDVKVPLEVVTTPVHSDHRYWRSFVPQFLPYTYFILYFLLTSMQELPITSITYVLTNDIGLDSTQLATYYTLCFIPWICKPVYGLISDNFPLFGYRRKSYLILTSLCASLMFLIICLYGHSYMVIQICGVAVALCIAFSEVQVDGLVIMLANTLARRKHDLHLEYPQFTQAKGQSDDEFHAQLTQEDLDRVSYVDYLLLTCKSPKATIQSESMTVRTFASLCSSLVSLIFHLFIQPRLMIGISSAVPVLLMFIGGVIPEIIQRNAFDEKANNGNSSNTEQTVVNTSIYDGNFTSHQEEVGYQYDADYDGDSSSVNSTATSDDEDDEECNSLRTIHNRPHKSSATYGSRGITVTATDSEDVEQGKPPAWHTIIKERVYALFQAFLLLYKPVIFVFIVACMPTSADALISYTFSELKLPPWILSGYAFISILGGLVGSFIYWKRLTRFTLLKVFFFTTCLAAVSSLTNVCLSSQCNSSIFHIPDPIFICIITFFNAICSRLAMMPTIILAAETYPTHLKLGLESTMFSMFTAVSNLGAMVSYAITVKLMKLFLITRTNFQYLPEFILVCAAGTLFPLFFLPLLTSAKYDNEKADYEARMQHLREERERLQNQQNVQNSIQQLTATGPIVIA